MHPFSTTQKVSCFSAFVHVVSIPTTVCHSPQTNDANKAALFQIDAALGALGFETRRQEAPRNVIQPPNYNAFVDGVSFPILISTQTCFYA